MVRQNNKGAIMASYNFKLNSDGSLVGVVYSAGEEERPRVMVQSKHTNHKNANNLVSNVSGIVSVEEKEGIIRIRLKNDVYVKINKQTGSVINENELTSFETRIFARAATPEALPFARFAEKPKQMVTDLHTHFAAALSPEQLIECGLGNGVRFTEETARKLKLNVKYIKKQEDGTYALEDVISTTSNYDLLVSSMKIDTSQQETFNKMEEIYTARGPFTKNPKMFVPMLWAIARDAQANGVKYMELSQSSIISNMSQLKMVEENLPAIEAETGVMLRFLGAMSRHSDKEWNDDETDKLKVAMKSPYVVGCDFMGHETNPTNDFYDNLKALAKHAMLTDPKFVIRAHAGENPLFKSNVRQVLLAVEDAHFELCQELGRDDIPYPQVRLGHGIYGFNEPPSWEEEGKRSYDISTEQLCKMIKPIVEFNMSSNLSLNNINGIDEIPIKRYVDLGVDVVLGTDGKGIYSTTIAQEMLLAHQAGITMEDFKSISRTEERVIATARARFAERLADPAGKSENISVAQQTCFSGGHRKFTPEVEKMHMEEAQRVQTSLGEMIANSGAETDVAKISDAIRGKRPIMITGASVKNYPKILEHPEQVRAFKIALETLTQIVDPDKAYIITGGTNHGVEGEMHKIAHDYNETHDKKFVILGTLTEEAAKNSHSPDERVRNTNRIDPNTITHAVIPTLNGKPAKRWFDLPDCSLTMARGGCVVAVGGGPIVSDMIQRGHNMGLTMHIMSGIVGASGEKSVSLAGNGYEFSNALEFAKKLIKENPDMIRSGLTYEKLLEIIQETTKKYSAPPTPPEKHEGQPNGKANSESTFGG